MRLIEDVAEDLAFEWHEGQFDKAGVEYFEHVATVANYGRNWKEKVVGYLHDVAEDTPHTIPETMEALKGHPIFRRDFPTDDDMAEIEDALNTMNHHTVPTREEYIARFKGHPLAIKVKLNDLRNNMDIARIPNPTDKDFERCHRYLNEYQTLIKML